MPPDTQLCGPGPIAISRRAVLGRLGQGLAGLALAALAHESAGPGRMSAVAAPGDNHPVGRPHFEGHDAPPWRN